VGQVNYSAFNIWKKVWVAVFIKKKHRFMIRTLNLLKHVRDGPLHWENAVRDFLEAFKTWLPLANYDIAEWIRRQRGELFWKKCASKIWEGRKKGRRGNKRPAMDSGELTSKKA
jgi:hypothetical protein